MKLQVATAGVGAAVPARGSEHAAGLDLYTPEPFDLWPETRKLIKTGVMVAIPIGFYGQIASRSGLAVRRGVVAFPGTIDADYRGEIGVLLFNHSSHRVEFEAHDRIAQLLIIPCATPTVVVVKELPATARGGGGFGSTGR